MWWACAVRQLGMHCNAWALLYKVGKVYLATLFKKSMIIAKSTKFWEKAKSICLRNIFQFFKKSKVKKQTFRTACEASRSKIREIFACYKILRRITSFTGPKVRWLQQILWPMHPISGRSSEIYPLIDKEFWNRIRWIIQVCNIFF